MRILIVDDDADFAEALRIFLQVSEHEVAVVGTGVDAIALVKEETFDVMLLDLLLPRLSGLEVMNQLSASESRLCVIAITGTDITERQAEDAGFHAAMKKPVDLPKLLRVLERLQ